MYLMDYLEERNDRCFEDWRSLIQDIKLKCILLFCIWCTKLYSSDIETIPGVLRVLVLIQSYLNFKNYIKGIDTGSTQKCNFSLVLLHKVEHNTHATSIPIVGTAFVERQKDAINSTANDYFTTQSSLLLL